jgi:hypothetical protein
MNKHLARRLKLPPTPGNNDFLILRRSHLTSPEVVLATDHTFDQDFLALCPNSSSDLHHLFFFFFFFFWKGGFN